MTIAGVFSGGVSVCGVVVHAIYVAGFTDHYTFWAWYYASGVLAAALVASYVPQWFALRLKLARTASPFVALSSLRLSSHCLEALRERRSRPSIRWRSARFEWTYRLTNTGGQRSSVRG